MNKILWKKARPHVIAIGIFFVVSAIYCLPAFQGKVLNQYDTQNWKGMAQQSIEFKEKFGHYPLWTNSMFSGMPTYQIAMDSRYPQIAPHLDQAFKLFLPEPASLFFLACIGFYILCMTVGVRSWVGILGSLGYSYATYSAVIVVVGHLTKFASMGYAPAVLAGLILLSQRKYILGFISTLVFTMLLTWQGHLQILYYTFLTAALLCIAYAINAIRQGKIKDLVITGALAVVSVGMGIGSFALNLLPTQEYAKESMRGGRSELTHPNEKKNVTKGGLDKDYAFTYSYGVPEGFAFVVPRIYGGSTPSVVNNQYVNEWGNDTKTAKVLAEKTGMGEDQASEIVKQFPAYWGTQASTAGPNYLGAVTCFLFILGLVFYRGWHLGWIIAASILGLVLAWGKNLPGINYFLFDHLPFYSKFRAPSMALVIPQLTFPLLAVLGLDRLLTANQNSALQWKKLKLALYITGGLVVLLVGMYFSFEYKGENDQAIRENLASRSLQQLSGGKQPTAEMEQQANEFGRSVANALKDDRRSLYGGDLLRSIILIALAASILVLYVRKKAPLQVVVVGLIALTLFDLIGIDLRYLTHSYYQEKDESTEFTPDRADMAIKADTGYFRVLNEIGGNLKTDSRTSYFHNSVGGYHPARLGLYEDLLDSQINKGNMNVLNMLNTKYFIIENPQDRQPMAQPNPGAFGPAWLVKAIKYVNNSNEEMKALDSLNTKDTVVIDKRERSKVPFTPQYDSTASIKLIKNLNDNISYQFSANSNQFVVFSEVYYPHGWKATIDGKESPIVKVDYALRGLAVPAGKHTIEFEFRPDSYFRGNMITFIIDIITTLVILGGLFYGWRKYKTSIV
jgi:hypothetical protein